MKTRAPLHEQFKFPKTFNDRKEDPNRNNHIKEKKEKLFKKLNSVVESIYL